MELRNGKKLSQPRYTPQRIAWEDKKQQISAAEAMVKLFDELCLKKAFQQLRAAAKSPEVMLAAYLGWKKFTGHKPASVAEIAKSSAGIVGWANYYKKHNKKTKPKQKQLQLSIYDRWRMDSEISGRL